MLIPGLHPGTGCADSYRNVLSEETFASPVWLSWGIRAACLHLSPSEPVLLNYSLIFVSDLRASGWF